MNASNRKNNVWAALVSLVVVVLVGILCVGSFLALQDNAPRSHAASPAKVSYQAYDGRYVAPRTWQGGDMPKLSCQIDPLLGPTALLGSIDASCPRTGTRMVHHVLPAAPTTTSDDSSNAAPTVANNNVPATVISNDSNNVAPIVVVDTCENGNPGNKACHGNAGEDPNGKGTMPKDSTDGNGEHGNQGNGKDK